MSKIIGRMAYRWNNSFNVQWLYDEWRYQAAFARSRSMRKRSKA